MIIGAVTVIKWIAAITGMVFFGLIVLALASCATVSVKSCGSRLNTISDNCRYEYATYAKSNYDVYNVPDPTCVKELLQDDSFMRINITQCQKSN